MRRPKTDRPLKPTIEAVNEVVKRKINDAHAAGFHTIHSDEKGIYRVYQNGTKEYIKLK